VFKSADSIPGNCILDTQSIGKGFGPKPAWRAHGQIFSENSPVAHSFYEGKGAVGKAWVQQAVTRIAQE
jgi:hypothetical protein